MAMVRIGLMGTGFVARLRADALIADGRGQLVAVAGHQPPVVEAFAQRYGAIPLPSWQDLVAHPKLDLVVVSHINRDHGAVVLAALAAHKHVVVEYPLALTVLDAEAALALAKANQRLLHVEHIELLGGTHLAFKAHLPSLGLPIYAHYSTLSLKSPAPESWTYSPELFGFPLIGALSRIHRLVDGFGRVERVYCQNHYEGLTTDPKGLTRYITCLCKAQLTFASGLMAEVVYGKGEGIWEGERRLAVWGQTGKIILDGEQGRVITAQGDQPISVGSRRGLFATDTKMVLDYLQDQTPLYCTPETSLYSLRVAAAAQESARTGQVVSMEQLLI
ncbi:MAG: Gfo/Idh/MocA family oxidoreductase [Leptolyngbyaceae cyanobacterium SM2_5_2]|nr:Gfo/Idh/MocA family oxidoreductase [Leptolyngbyaceae cyanobacterium SM2_5_2]